MIQSLVQHLKHCDIKVKKLLLGKSGESKRKLFFCAPNYLPKNLLKYCTVASNYPVPIDRPVRTETSCLTKCITVHI